jgi:hypothetical protein
MARKRPAVHCTAHRTDSEPCSGWAVHGAKVCQAHGGRAPQVQAAATERLAVEVANRLAIPVETTAADALQDGLARMNGEVLFLAERVAQIPEDELTWGVVSRRIRPAAVPGGQSVVEVTQATRRHPLWVALTDATTRRTAIAAEMSRLGIEQRRAVLDEQLAHLIAAPFFGLLAELRVAWQLDRDQEKQVKAMIARQLRAIEGGRSAGASGS